MVYLAESDVRGLVKLNAVLNLECAVIKALTGTCQFSRCYIPKYTYKEQSENRVFFVALFFLPKSRFFVCAYLPLTATC